MKSPFLSIFKMFFSLKKRIYRCVLSKNRPVSLGAIKQPTLFLGDGKITISKTATLGYFPSPYFYSGYMHIEARSPDAEIFVGEKTFINNNAVIIAEQSKIRIGANCLIGANFHCVSSDFHGLDPKKRECYVSADVVISDNIFIGNNVSILKGVHVGSGSTIAAGAVVTKSFPENVLIGGNPAKIIKFLNTENHEHSTNS